MSVNEGWASAISMDKLWRRDRVKGGRKRMPEYREVEKNSKKLYKCCLISDYGLWDSEYIFTTSTANLVLTLRAKVKYPMIWDWLKRRRENKNKTRNEKESKTKRTF